MYDSSARLKMTVNIAGAIVRVQDLEKSKAFYSQALKLPVSSSSGNTADVEVTLGLTLKLEQYEPTASRKEYKRGEVSIGLYFTVFLAKF